LNLANYRFILKFEVGYDLFKLIMVSQNERPFTKYIIGNLLCLFTIFSLFS